MSLKNRIILYMLKRGIFHKMSDVEIIKRMYHISLHNELDLDNPTTFSEKIQWLKLNDRKPIYTVMVDKYSVKKYVSSIIGKKHIIPTLGVWNNFTDIDFDSLPNQFVLKCTHDSGSYIIVKDKTEFDKKSAKKKLEKGLKRNYYFVGREWPYKNVKPRIIAEPLLNDGSEQLNDYKIYCFNGIPKYCQVIGNRSKDITIDFFDLDWRHQPFIGLNPLSRNSIVEIQRPRYLELMIKFSGMLSKDTYFCRIDFYEVNNKLYFGEITFYPLSGFGFFRPSEWNTIIGNLIELPM